MVTAGDRLGMLAGVPLFEGLSKRELRTIHRVARVVDFPAGAKIVEEGMPGAAFHLLLEGQAKVVAGGRVRARLGPGSFFGEMALIDGGLRSATVAAETPVSTLSLVSWDFLPLLEANPSIARKILVEMCRRLRALERSVIA